MCYNAGNRTGRCWISGVCLLVIISWLLGENDADVYYRETNDVIEVDVGQNVTLHCRTATDGHVSWTMSDLAVNDVRHISEDGLLMNGFLASGRFELVKSSSAFTHATDLKITGVGTQDRGVYHCVGEKGASVERRNIVLKVIDGASEIKMEQSTTAVYDGAGVTTERDPSNTTSLSSTHAVITNLTAYVWEVLGIVSTSGFAMMCLFGTIFCIIICTLYKRGLLKRPSLSCTATSRDEEASISLLSPRYADASCQPASASSNDLSTGEHKILPLPPEVLEIILVTAAVLANNQKSPALCNTRERRYPVRSDPKFVALLSVCHEWLWLLTGRKWNRHKVKHLIKRKVPVDFLKVASIIRNQQRNNPMTLRDAYSTLYITVASVNRSWWHVMKAGRHDQRLLFCVKAGRQLVATLHTDGYVCALANIGDKIYAIGANPRQIQVFSMGPSYSSIGSISADYLRNPVDMVGYEKSQQLYVADFSSQCVWCLGVRTGGVVDDDTSMIASGYIPVSLSLTSNRLLVVPNSSDALYIYDVETCQPIQKIAIALKNVFHAVESTEGEFIVGYVIVRQNERNEQLENSARLSKLYAKSKSTAYGPEWRAEEILTYIPDTDAGRRTLTTPCHLALCPDGSVLVADSGTRRVTLIDKDFQFKDIALNYQSDKVSIPPTRMCRVRTYGLCVTVLGYNNAGIYVYELDGYRRRTS